MKKKNYDKKVALKLINKYADQYNRIEEEKKSLELENNDLKSNIKVNKEIINTFFSKISLEEKFKNFIKNFTDENNILNNRITQLNKENKILRLKIEKYEKIINKEINIYRENTDELNNKIYVLQNLVNKKDNIITSLTNNLNKIKSLKINEDENNNNKFNQVNNINLGEEEESEENYSNNSNENSKKNYKININKNNNNNYFEIYVIEPTKSVNLIHYDLMLYKQAYENALNKIRDLYNTIKKYEKRISILKSDLYKLKNSEDCDKKKETFSSSNSDITNNNSNNIDNINISYEKFNYLIKYVKLSKNEISDIKFDVRNKINEYIINITENILKIKNENKELINYNKKLINENLSFIKDYIKLKNNYYNITHRKNSKNTIESYLITDISYKGNYDNNDFKNKNNNKLSKIKKNNFKNNLILDQKNINNNNKNNFLDVQDKSNQSADNIKEELDIYFEEERKKNLTEVNFDEFAEEYQKYYNKFGKES